MASWSAPKTDWDPADGVADTDMNRIEDNTLWLREEHVDLDAGHGAVSAATPSKIIIRDASGRAKVAAPSAGDDIAILSDITGHTTDTANPHGTTKTHVGLSDVTNDEQVAKAGDTMLGILVGFDNASYTTKQFRNFFINNTSPTTEGENGDVWLEWE